MTFLERVRRGNPTDIVEVDEGLYADSEEMIEFAEDGVLFHFAAKLLRAAYSK